MEFQVAISFNRISTWEQALSDYIASKRDEPFVYGVNDCCMFAAGAVEVMTNEDPMAEFRGKYRSLAGSVRALKEIGNGDLESTIDAKFAVIPVGLAQRGDLAYFDNSIGIIMDSWAWFVSDDGLERVPRSMWDKAWSVGRG
jgi:hypothetical protein